jgi:hypothetical protein
MNFKGDKESLDVSFWVKDGHVRMQFKGRQKDQAGEMILRDGMSSMLVIMPQQRMYMEMPLPQSLKDPDSEAQDKEEEFPFSKTGETKDILGFKAHEYIMESDGEKITVWATEELGAMPFANNPMLQGWTETMRRMTGLDAFFPLETRGTENGKDAYELTVTQIEEKSLPDALFLPPEGYQKFSMPTGMPGMMPGR